MFYKGLKLRILFKVLILLAVCEVVLFNSAAYPYSIKGSSEKQVNKAEEASKNDKIVNPHTAYSYEAMIEDAEMLSKRYPDLIKTKSIGKSVEGRDLRLIALGNGEKKVLLNGSHHAREYITSSFLMNMVEDYADAYCRGVKLGGYDIKSILDTVTFLVIPMVNPDGVNLVQKGIKAVKSPGEVRKMKLINRRYGYRSWKANINGVDLNRNYPTGWEERKSSVKVPSSEQYKGKKAGSEPEVKWMMEFVNSNKDICIYASYHTQGEVIYWSDHKCKISEDEKVLAKTLAAKTGFALVNTEESVGDYGGGFSEWTRKELKKPSFTIELCPYIGSYPYPDSSFDRVWKTARFTGLIIGEALLNTKNKISKQEK